MKLSFLLACFVLFSIAWSQTHRKGDGYEWFCVGRCSGRCVNCVAPQGGTMLMGGSTDVDEAFKWLIKNSGGGNILILRASGADGYNSYIYNLGGVESVATIVFSNAKASADPFVLEKVSEATAVFFAGGDQSVYMNYWNQTSLQVLLQSMANNHITMGGTSAGMAIMGEYVYTAHTGSVTSSEALADPYHPSITIGVDFFYYPYLRGVITDTHFYQRDRMGRSVAFMARIKQDWTGLVRGIACDEATGVIFDEYGLGRVVTASKTNDYCYFFEAPNPPTVCRPGTPLSVSGVNVQRVTPGDTFNLVSWSSRNAKVYQLSATRGVLSSVGNSGKIY
eukprot:TRINITY_DN2618_c0_g4_i1.p1 TRINITY_DN2618_c0_g4~~TRINITY_DN2618_c0_g4_i1.p1  ORF type:complete len:336 (+),score=51.65 TRINITY_DN2618_c0_g4_i1:54-1061(+)